MDFTKEHQQLLRTVSEISLTLNDTPCTFDKKMKCIRWDNVSLNLEDMTLSVAVNGEGRLSIIQYRALEGIALKNGYIHEIYQAPLTVKEEIEHLNEMRLLEIMMMQELENDAI